jgi:hypothetical protein
MSEINFFFFFGQIRFYGLFPFRTDLKVFILQAIDTNSWTGDQPFTRPLAIQENTNTEELRNTAMS